MKRLTFFITLLAATPSVLSSCGGTSGQDHSSFLLATDEKPFSATSPDIARMLAALPIADSHLQEVHQAAQTSSGKGLDEEYMFRDVLDGTRAGCSPESLGSLIETYIYGKCATKGADPRKYIDELASSGLQIYWPYSDDWDGQEMPLVTFDPGYGLESNHAYRLGSPDDSVLVDEAYAMEHPVWVVNSNSDDGFEPIFIPNAEKSVQQAPSATYRRLVLKSFTMLRPYDTWFGGASEFWVKCGAVDGFSASTEAELRLYYPSVTDFLIVVKRRYLKKELPLDALILTDFSNQLEKLAFLVTEDDGGTRTSWKCNAVVKIKSKSYGIELELPYNDKDDIVWRGQLAASFFQEADEVEGRFGDVMMKFALE